MTYIGSIDLRRIWIADEEKGLVFAYTMWKQVALYGRSMDSEHQKLFGPREGAGS